MPPACSTSVRGTKMQLLSQRPSNQSRSPTKCPHRGWRRLVAEVEVAELGPEGGDELLAELLVLGGAVLDHDDLVVEVVDVTLVCTRQGVERAAGLAPHVVE